MVRAGLRVRRFDPQQGSEPTWSTYQVELPDGSTVLEALMKIQDEQDGTLSFRRACRHAICGSCAMMINGCSKLACNTQVSLAAEQAARMAAHGREAWRDGREDAAAEDAAAEGAAAEGAAAPILIEPLGNMPVVKDLVTDMDAFWRKQRRVRPWLFAPDDGIDPDHERRMSPPEWDRMAQGLLCLECGSCYSECDAVTASPEFVGPAALAKAHRYTTDTRDADAHQRLADLSDEHGLWECMRCYFCSERCPKRIRVRDLIAQLGELAVRDGLDTDPGARHAAAFVESLEKSGRLDETRLAVRSQGVGWAARRLPMAVRVAMAGKLSLPPRPIDGHEALRRVIDAARADKGGAGEAGTAGAADDAGRDD